VAPLVPCLWFDGNADEAVDHYLSIFPNSKRHGASQQEGSEAGAPSPSLMVSFELDGSPLLALNGGPDYSFTPAVSFVITCDSQPEIDHYWDRLTDGGEPGRCGWLTDRFGVSWQVVPSRMGELMSDPDPDQVGRVVQAMLQMTKLDIAALEAAAEGD